MYALNNIFSRQYYVTWLIFIYHTLRSCLKLVTWLDDLVVYMICSQWAVKSFKLKNSLSIMFYFFLLFPMCSLLLLIRHHKIWYAMQREHISLHQDYLNACNQLLDSEVVLYWAWSVFSSFQFACIKHRSPFCSSLRPWISNKSHGLHFLK